MPSLPADDAGAAPDDAQNHTVCEPCPALTGLGWCAAQCAQLNFSLAGVEAGHECVCGNSLADASQAVPAAQCDSPCVSDPSASCGGIFRVLVANVSDVPPAPPPPPPPAPDYLEPRDIRAGILVANDSYLDQAYLLRTQCI
jgi:hypothetical protein